MKKGLLITLPQHDDTMEYISVFSKPIIDEAEKRLINIKKIKRKEITKGNFEKIIKSLDYRMNILNGHGSPSCIFGHDNKPILIAGDNHNLITEKITYARSCHSGSILGRISMENSKTGCFIGYNLPFMFFIDKTHQTNPSKDNTAKIFLEPSNNVPISILKGNSTSDAHENGKRQMLKAINKLLTDSNDQSLAFAEALWNNYIGQVIIGNKNAKLD
jgi:hypothetical protein